MSWVAAAMAGGSALSMGGSIFGGMFGSSAEKKRAAAIQAAGQQASSDILNAGKSANTQIQNQLNVARGDLSPFQGYGVQAGNSLMSMLLGGQTPASLLKASDLFKFQSDLGSRNIDRELSARGLYGSGAGLETLARFNNQLVGEEGQRLVDRLMNMTQLGGSAANSLADMTTRAGFAQGQNLYNSGVESATMRYNSLLGAAQATASATQAIGGMGQSLFDAAGGGVQQFGQFKAAQPQLQRSNQLFDLLLQKMSGGGSGGNAGNLSMTGGGGNSLSQYGFSSML